MIDTPTERNTVPAPADRAHRLTVAAGTVGSTVAAAVGLAWLLLPAVPYPGYETTLLAQWIGSGAAVVIQTVLGLLGVATGIAALTGALPRPGLVVGGLLQTIGFGIGLENALVLNVIGYLLGMAMPVIGVILLVQLFRRYPRLRWRVGAPIAIALIGVVLLLGREIAGLAALFAVELAPQLPAMSIMMLLPLTAFGWTAAVATGVAGTPGEQRATGWVVRHRTVFTVVAACCLLPYTLVRLTWLTPWPLIGGDGIDLQTRIWGTLLGSAGWLGFVLTLGLIRPWGEIFPRWMPGLAGRPVPIAMAAVPAGAVAAFVCAAAVPWLVAAGRNIPDTAGLQSGTPASADQADALLQALISLVFFPCWLWGPTLALAVWGYVGHRLSGPRSWTLRSTAGR